MRSGVTFSQLLQKCEEGISKEGSRSFAHGCLSRIMRALEDENIARRPTREHPIADIQRVAKEVLVEDVGDELLAGRPFNRDLDIGSLIFDRVDLAEQCINFV